MPRSRPIYINDAAQEFRRIIRPEMFGNIGHIEPIIAVRAAVELGSWMADLVAKTMQVTDLNDKKGEAKRQLFGGIRITGRASLARLVGRIDAQPWLFAQEYGAHIEAKGKMLTIPFGFALRPDGSPKFRTAGSWKRFGSFIRKDKASGKLFIVYKAANGDLRYLYRLVDEVEVKPVLHLIRTAGSLIDLLWVSWGEIYLQEMLRAGILDQSGLTRAL